MIHHSSKFSKQTCHKPDLLKVLFLVEFRLKKACLSVFISLWVAMVHGQVTTDPQVPSADSEIRILYDASQGTSGLVGASKVYMHAGAVLSSPSGTGWDVIVGNWGADDGIGEMTRVSGENDIWEITLTPRTYFDISTEPIYRIGMVFRNSDGSEEGKTDGNSDFFIDLLQDGYGLVLIQPSTSSFLVDTGEMISIEVAASEESNFTLTIGDSEIESTSSQSSYSYIHEVTEMEGSVQVSIEGSNGTDSDAVSFTYSVRPTTTEEAVPDGIVKGINYHEDLTKVTLCLEAPLKSTVYAVGEFNNWQADASSIMKKDHDLFWLEISGLTPGEPYGFQYWVDESIFIADPYSDLILSPLDEYISEKVYPDIKSYPEEALHSDINQERVSVLQTNQSPYEWNVTNFQRPDKDELVIYELLMRDFFERTEQSYQNLIDTLSYLADLGINAIELMPVNEFGGNESWGYDPEFTFALDKAYGSEDKFKEFVDKAHELGIAVIIDMVLNHHNVPNPYVSMYFDFVNWKPTANNPWFNVDATHPFNVFYDYNHESQYTKDYMDSVNTYWLREYNIDGFRFDLSKGFTQTNYGDDVGAWSGYDQGRVDILQRMADVIWEESDDAYIILEHLGDNSEEKVLADYGMMLWGKMNDPYGQLVMGYSSESHISWVDSDVRGWNDRNLVGYMESHDEERLMYKAAAYGNENSSYSTKDYDTALERVMAASAFFYTIPGPKMLWQFGEVGFDYSINRCEDGSISEDCRLSVKPTTWHYLDDQKNQDLFQVTSEIIQLKTSHEVFQNGTASFYNDGSLTRYIWITHESDMDVLVMGNFDVSEKTMNVNFPHDGTWYHYFDQGKAEEIVGGMNFILQPGEFRIYTDAVLDSPEAELISNLTPLAPSNLEINDTSSGLELTWQDNSRINTGFRIYRKEAGAEFELLDNTGSTSYTDVTAQNGVTYIYQVVAYTTVAESVGVESEVTVSNFILGSINETDSVVYPNPSNGLVTIHVAGESPLSYVIYDLNGRISIEGKFSKSENSLDLGNLIPGTYIAEIITRGGKSFFAKIHKK